VRLKTNELMSAFPLFSYW